MSIGFYNTESTGTFDKFFQWKDEGKRWIVMG